MRNSINIIIALIVAIFVLVSTGVFYTVDETKQVVVTQFGELKGEPIVKSGLYFKFPWQKANYFERRILQWDGDANQIPTRDKRFIWVDTMARWRIKDPLKFMQSVRTEAGAQTRLDDIIDASTRAVLSSNRLIEAIRSSNRILESVDLTGLSDSEKLGKTEIEEIKSGREELARLIFTRAAESMPSYGIELVDVQIKRINYVEEVQRKVYERMISERNRAAEQFRSEGQGKRAEIEGQMAKELQEIQSEAYKTAQKIKGKADAKAIKIYANAYNKDPDFYSFVKTLETYKRTLGKDTNLILSTDNDFFQQLKGDWETSKE